MRKQYRIADAPSIADIDLLEVRRDVGYSISFPTGRKKNGFVYVLSGGVEYSFTYPDKKRIVVSESDLLFIPSGSIYSAIYFKPDSRIKIVQFDLAFGELPSALREPVELQASGAAEIMESIFVNGYTDNSALYRSYRIYELLWCAAHSLEPEESGRDRLAPAIDEMCKNYREQRSVRYYADLCYMSETNFRRAFKVRTGEPPIEYRNRLRLAEARGLVSSGEYTVEEAARAVGFSNVSFFCRAYKSTFGTTPKGK